MWQMSDFEAAAFLLIVALMVAVTVAREVAGDHGLNTYPVKSILRSASNLAAIVSTVPV